MSDGLTESGMPIHLTVYIRPDCHLCTDMVNELEELKTELNFDYALCDIETDSALVEKYATRVPVLVGGAIEVCWYFLDRDCLREYCRSV